MTTKNTTTIDKLKNRSKVVKEVVETQVDKATGEAFRTVTSQTFVSKNTEPDFVKIYIGNILLIEGININLDKTLLAMVKRMNYADYDEPEAGQIIVLNSTIKKQIAKEAETSEQMVNKRISTLAKSNIIRRTGRGVYQFNPNYFGRGDWSSIKKIKALFEYSDKGITVNSEVEDSQSEKKKEEA